jgi:CubicO group peptidase (beta-lactamase class C family)
MTVEQAMADAVGASVFPGAVLLVSRGRDILFHRAFGVADLCSRESVTQDTLFDLASLTKPLATTAALIHLVQTNRLRLDQTLGDLLPEVAGRDKSGITVEHLLRHRSGLPAHRPYYVQMMQIPEQQRQACLRQLVLNEPLGCRPGEKELYSDLGFILLAWIVARVAGQRLDHYVRDSIYRPLGIERLHFRRAGQSLDAGIAATEHCPWRGRVLKGEVHDDNAWAAGGIEGHAGLFGTALDIGTLLGEIMGGLTGKKTGVLEGRWIRQFAVKADGFERVAGFDTPSARNSSSGRFFSPASLGHLGFTGTSFWMDPLGEAMVILLTNRVHPVRRNEKIRQFRPYIHDLIMEALFKRG